MNESQRVTKRTKFGSTKHVYPKEVMRQLRAFFDERVAAVLPKAKILYWT